MHALGGFFAVLVPLGVVSGDPLPASARPSEGRKPFGHYEGEKATLERMEALRATGLGFDRLAAKLSAEGFLTRTGKAWQGKTVNRILTRRKAS